MIFFSYDSNKNDFVAVNTDKHFTRRAFDIVKKTLFNELGQEWLNEAQTEADAFGNLDLIELSQSEFMLAYNELKKASDSETNELSNIRLLFNEIEPFFKNDPRFKHE